ncbi:MAG: MgtC/SapB family protein [Sedimentisphaerales bacterium]|nr:MgtC/SapB family protein [Sedimentisphaerales bacterium]
MDINWPDIISLVVATILGGAIGFEREVHNKPAGLRTNLLISLGSCVFTIISLNFAGGEPARIAANIVSGIGFLGAGAIIQSRGSIQGLTSAAGIWIVAGIGMACGAKFYFLAISATVLALIALRLLTHFERKFAKEQGDKALFNQDD